MNKGNRTKVYFAHPYASHERGTNENFNGIIRRFIPKGIPINKYSNEYIDNITIAINSKCRKINGYKSSYELYNNDLKKLVLS